MNIEFLRSPWFMLAVLLLVAGAFILAVPGWPVLGWGAVVAGLLLMGYARYRQG
ncbi:hypothetical protein [Zhihengliuella flava]|uniref:Uncharacterized protein n=1 Tax=Zhihengliuella flava TaxID=1285193 RepID=A0A931DC26_9MICC|nr:hypothetical protein [Zhihengliuella flava]MBG6084671.1 hypothetical protein [Zhihengliuella flava]